MIRFALPCRRLALVLDDHLAQHHRHAKQVRPRDGVLEARERRLGSKGVAVDGIAPDEHLVDGIVGEAGRVVAVGVATPDREDAAAGTVPRSS